MLLSFREGMRLSGVMVIMRYCDLLHLHSNDVFFTRAPVILLMFRYTSVESTSANDFQKKKNNTRSIQRVF